MYPKSLRNLIDNFRRLPGVGEKTAERYALSVADMDPVDVESFAASLLDVKEHLRHCEICGNLSDEDECDICKDESRDHQTIFVVESSRDIIAMEKTGDYHGVYHVLNGLISTSKGVLPEDLNIDQLVKRADGSKEIILATSATRDGEITAMYLEKLLHQKYPDLLITRIAHGLPAGGMLDYADEMTLSHALSDRKSME
ncbi:MAG: recombination mediator RecR [Solobacterium sp.]|jgi:recombination protein RecR|nr:recombination mediator RecR [Solobacterium sp.]MCH4049009.1 recombination mediator RecR [Solobacterium sp.]MCH4074237.1 recombination mediator RecR [Solobacterium sp.]MCI1313566.1 recombination mediator RecR [Solobacterium sp.]MCI1345726.1 recombination mediator RecR [Solobacterium sp.]